MYNLATTAPSTTCMRNSRSSKRARQIRSSIRRAAPWRRTCRRPCSTPRWPSSSRPRVPESVTGMSSPKTSKLDAALQEAVQHHQAGRLAEAEKLYRRILRERPSHPAANNALGIALKDQGKADEAAALFRRVVNVAPDNAGAHSNLGNVLFEQGKLTEAEACYRRALAIKPDMIDALKNLGLVIVDQGRSSDSIGLFRRHAVLAFGPPDAAARSREQTPPHKARHDQEQREYLAATGVMAPFNLEEGERVSGRAVNPDQSHGEIAARWQTSSPQIAVIDNLLTDEALERLRHYCWRSTVWQKSYPNGYL